MERPPFANNGRGEASLAALTWIKMFWGLVMTDRFFDPLRPVEQLMVLERQQTTLCASRQRPWTGGRPC